MTDKNVKTETHFFASFGLGWATGETRDAAIRKLINGFRSDLKPWILNSVKENLPGVYIWTCEVMTPQETKYKINFYQPVGVEKQNGAEHYVTRVTQKTENYFNVADIVK